MRGRRGAAGSPAMMPSMKSRGSALESLDPVHGDLVADRFRAGVEHDGREIEHFAAAAGDPDQALGALDFEEVVEGVVGGADAHLGGAGVFEDGQAVDVPEPPDDDAGRVDHVVVGAGDGSADRRRLADPPHGGGELVGALVVEQAAGVEQADRGAR